MNELPSKTLNGTFGELVAQLELLRYGVQAAPPLRDSGNDLIACKGPIILALQIKSRLRYSFSRSRLPKEYHGVILIKFGSDKGRVDLDAEKPAIYLMTRREFVNAKHLGRKGLADFSLDTRRVSKVFRRENMISASDFKTEQH